VPTLRLKRLVTDTPTPGLVIILEEVELVLGLDCTKATGLD